MTTLVSESAPPSVPVADTGRWVVGAVAVGSIAVAVVGTLRLADARDIEVSDIVRVVLVGAWAFAGAAAARRTSTRDIGRIALAGAFLMAVRLVLMGLAASGDASDAAEVIIPLTEGLLVAVAVHFLAALPDGRLIDGIRRNGVIVAYAGGVLLALQRWADRPDPSVTPLVLVTVVGLSGAMLAANRRYPMLRGTSRHQMQWLGLAITLVAEAALIILSLHVLIDWPAAVSDAITASLVLPAVGLAAAASPRLVGHVERVLAQAMSAAGLTALVVVVYLVIVLGLGRVPTDEERTILLLSMVAAAVSAALFTPTRERVGETVNRMVYGEPKDPTDALETFGTRMTRAVPMEELLLQLVELLKKHMDLVSSEVWTGTGGRLERAASVPERGPGLLVLDDKEHPVVTRSGVAGRGWASVWLAELVAERAEGAPIRVAPMTDAGELFGLVVVERRPGDDEFSEDDERVLTELARQVGLALRNSELDSALQESLAEVERKNVELQASRSRIVATADAERRKIERNLHDGAQQHLVALAVKLRLIQRIAESDPEQAKSMLEEARSDALGTVEELRALAHGIYPPLLMDRGLSDALSAAAGRSSLPTSVDAEGVGRHRQDIEAAVYFCCLEAMQNAGKHAGEGATIQILVQETDEKLTFSIIDDGAGFDLADAGGGHGFVNMADRLGAIGGQVEVRSAPGQGTKIIGRIPLDATTVAEATV